MKDEKARVLSNVPIARDVWKLDLETDMACEPGQFVEVKCGGLFLRRPISVCEARNGVLTLIYKVVGRGTDWMSGLEQGQKVDVFGPLGTGFPPSRADSSRGISAQPVGNEEQQPESVLLIGAVWVCPRWS